MEGITIIINDAPYGSEKPWNALRLAKALAVKKQGVNIFLMGDGAAIAKKGQEPPQGFYNLGKMLADLIGLGAGVRVCGTCLESRGIKPEELIEGAAAGKMLDLEHWVETSAKVISF